MALLQTAIKIVWTRKMTSEYCCSLIDSMPHKMAAVVKTEEALQNIKVNDVLLRLW